jgi:hypothetical protein
MELWLAISIIAFVVVITTDTVQHRRRNVDKDR